MTAAHAVETGALDRAKAEAFAAEWIAAWNTHDLERVLGHYEDDFEFSSPFVIDIAAEPSGRLRGKAAIRDYWAKALARNPRLRFELENVYWGVRTLVIQYRRHDGRVASEWFEFGDRGKVLRSSAQYGV
jgi:ketosteroid isomerase-like protein